MLTFVALHHWGGRTRTFNFLINSQAVCQLTYAPSLVLLFETPFNKKARRSIWRAAFPINTRVSARSLRGVPIIASIEILCARQHTKQASADRSKVNRVRPYPCDALPDVWVTDRPMGAAAAACVFRGPAGSFADDSKPNPTLTFA